MNNLLRCYNLIIGTKILHISLATIIVLTILLSVPSRITYNSPVHAKASQKAEVIPQVPAILEKIAWCESKGRQFNADGSVHRGEVNPQDVGKFQINEHYHLETSQKLGMNIYTLEGNTDYALYLYSRNGTRDWNWSKHCWSQL